MSNRRERWRVVLPALTEEYRSAFGDLPAEALQWKPAADRWSIAQVLDHVMQLNRSYYPTFEQIEGGRYRPGWATHIPFVPQQLGKLLLRSVSPEARRPVRTLGIWEPAESGLPPNILEEFVGEQEVLARWLERLEPYFGKGLIITSPSSRFLPYPLDIAVEAMLAHEQRHFQQAMEVKTAWAKAQAG